MRISRALAVSSIFDAESASRSDRTILSFPCHGIFNSVKIDPQNSLSNDWDAESAPSEPGLRVCAHERAIQLDCLWKNRAISAKIVTLFAVVFNGDNPCHGCHSQSRMNKSISLAEFPLYSMWVECEELSARNRTRFRIRSSTTPCAHTVTMYQSRVQSVRLRGLGYVQSAVFPR